jgi:hypothetical protein
MYVCMIEDAVVGLYTDINYVMELKQRYETSGKTNFRWFEMTPDDTIYDEYLSNFDELYRVELDDKLNVVGVSDIHMTAYEPHHYDDYLIPHVHRMDVLNSKVRKMSFDWAVTLFAPNEEEARREAVRAVNEFLVEQVDKQIAYREETGDMVKYTVDGKNVLDL